MNAEQRLHHLGKVERMLAKLCPPDRLVVQSMPFGALVDNDTGRPFTPQITDPDIAYGIASAIKLAAEMVRDDR